MALKFAAPGRQRGVAAVQFTLRQRHGGRLRRRTPFDDPTDSVPLTIATRQSSTFAKATLLRLLRDLAIAVLPLRLNAALLDLGTLDGRVGQVGARRCDVVVSPPLGGAVSTLVGGCVLDLRPVPAICGGSGALRLRTGSCAGLGVAVTLKAIVVTELVRAWGRGNVLDEYVSVKLRASATVAKGANADPMGELLYGVGAMSVQPRVTVVLGMALTSGCLPSGEAKPTETTTPEIPVGE